MRSRSLLIFAGLTALITIASAACSGEDEKTASELAVEANAQVLCERLFSCCTPPELDALPFVDERKPPTQEGCVAYHTKTALGFLSLTEGTAATGRVALHVDRSSSCVEKVRSESCGAFHSRLPRLHLADAYALCNTDIVEPLVDDERPCTLYLDCKGGFCRTPEGSAADGGTETNGTCKSLPKASVRCVVDGCAEGLRCDRDTTLCKPFIEVGGDCLDDNACASGACRGRRCVSPGRCGG
jgi:hypothetical protein